MNNLPSCVSGFYLVPAFTLSVSELSVHLAAQFSRFLCQVHDEVPKLQILVAGYRGGPRHMVASAGLSHKGSPMNAQGFGVYGKA